MSVSIPSQGTHFSDGVRTGPILASSYTAGANVLTPSSLNQSPIDTQPPGVFNTPMALMNFQPYPVNATALAGSQSPGAAGYITFVTSSGPGVKVIASVGGQTGPAGASVLQLDVPRNVTIVSGGNDSTKHVTVFGWDLYNEPMTEQITLTNGGTALGKKAFKTVRGIYISAASASTITCGVGNVFGFPYLLQDVNYAFTPMWNGLPEFLTPVVIAPTPITLGNNPLTTDGSTATVVVAYTATAPLFIGQEIKIAGATATGGISAANLNIEATITAISANTSFSYVANAVSTSATSGGGAAVTVTFLTPDVTSAIGTVIAGVQATATATTGDVRGTYTPSTAAAGTQRLTINFYQPSADGRVYNGASFGSLILQSNSLSSTNLSATVNVFAPDHQLTTGELVTISGATTFGGISVGNLNLSNTAVTVVDENNFTYTAGAAATSTTTGGGSAILLSPSRGNLYQVPQGRFGVQQYSVALF